MKNKEKTREKVALSFIAMGIVGILTTVIIILIQQG